jgi:hypothetical protein
MVGVSVMVGVGVIVGVEDGVDVFVDVGVGVFVGVGVNVGVMLGVGVEVAKNEIPELHPESKIPIQIKHPIGNINPVHRNHFLIPIPAPQMSINKLQTFLYQNPIILSNLRTLVKYLLFRFLN